MKIKLGDITPRMLNNICLNINGDCGICPFGGSFMGSQNKIQYYCNMNDVFEEVRSEDPMFFDDEVEIPEGLLKKIAKEVCSKNDQDNQKW